MSTLSPVQQLILQAFVILPEDKTAFRRWRAVEKTAIWRKNNPSRRLDWDRKWRKENHEKELVRCREKRTRLGKQEIAQRQRRLETDPVFRLTFRLRNRLLQALSGRCKSAKTMELLGCTVPEWVAHLEKQFRPGMTWENYGPVWHIDHIRPCVSFDLTDPVQQRACFNWSNTQPLFAEENLQKGGRYFTETSGR